MNLLDILQKPEQKHSVSESLRINKDKTFRQYLEYLKENDLMDWFLNTKINEILKLKDIKNIEHKEVEDIEIYKDQLLLLLKEEGLSSNREKRGITSSEILENLGGNPIQLRKFLEELKKEKKIFSTGKTQGKRWVLWELKDVAEKNYLRRK